MSMARHNEIGKIGEDIAVKWLKNHHHEILARNYREPWGELDIVSRDKDNVHFIEVKSVQADLHHPEKLAIAPHENMTPSKRQKLQRIIETFLEKENVPETIEWQVDLACVYVDLARRRGRVLMEWDIVL